MRYDFDYALPPEGEGKYQVVEIRFEESKEAKKPMMAVVFEYIEDGPDMGTKLTERFTYHEGFVLKRVKYLFACLQDKEPETITIDSKDLDHEAYRMEITKAFTGSKLGVNVKYVDGKKNNKFATATAFMGLADVDEARSKKEAQPTPSAPSQVPSSLRGIL